MWGQSVPACWSVHTSTHIFRHSELKLREIASNIAKTLGPVAQSPWLEEIHEEFYDWLEVNVWGDFFNQYYDGGSKSVLGWRKTRSEWLLLY